MKVKLEIRQEDLDKGKPRRSCDCPVALAANRAFGGKWTVGTIDLIELYTLQGFVMPENMKKYVFEIDCGRTVDPSDFYLEELWASPIK